MPLKPIIRVGQFCIQKIIVDMKMMKYHYSNLELWTKMLIIYFVNKAF